MSVSLEMHELIQAQIRHSLHERELVNTVWYRYITNMEIPVDIRLQIYATSGWRQILHYVPEVVIHNRPLHEFVMKNYVDHALLNIHRLLLDYCDKTGAEFSDELKNAAMKSGHTHFINYVK